MATHSSTLAWKIPWAEEPGRLQSMGSLRVGHDWATSLSLFTFTHWRRKWQPTPVFLPGESQGQEPGGLPSTGSHRVGHDWSNLAAAAAMYYSCQHSQSIQIQLVPIKAQGQENRCQSLPKARMTDAFSTPLLPSQRRSPELVPFPNHDELCQPWQVTPPLCSQCPSRIQTTSVLWAL